MAKYKVEYNRDTCIGVGACVGAGPDIWTIESEDKRADIIKTLNPKVEGSMQFLDFEEADLKKHMEAAQVCPVFAIVIKDSTGKQLWPE